MIRSVHSPGSSARISVVVITYDDQANLDRVLTALDRQVGAEFEVIVADDGSRLEPVLGRRRYPVQLVRQADLGFRAAAARNLGARHAHGDVLLFLDGDTIPEPGYVATLAAACLAAGARAPGSSAGRGLAVGARRHADFGDVTALPPLPPPAESMLPDPAWLARGFEATDGLRRPGDRSYRFVISAVLAITRELFEVTGGFDESFVGYGGEDWELANRCYLAGAEFVHEPRAVAWHDGPDVAGRDLASPAEDERRLAMKNAEIRRVAEVVTEPQARDPRLLWEIPDIAIDLDNRGWPPETTLRVCVGLLDGSDARVWAHDSGLLEGGLWPASDPRVQAAPIPDAVRARSRFRVRVDRPVVPATGSLADVCVRGPASYPGLVITHARDAARGTAPPEGDPTIVAAVSSDRRLEAVWAGWGH